MLFLFKSREVFNVFLSFNLPATAGLVYWRLCCGLTEKEGEGRHLATNNTHDIVQFTPPRRESHLERTPPTNNTLPQHKHRLTTNTCLANSSSTYFVSIANSFSRNSLIVYVTVRIGNKTFLYY